jgi:hypothetical protein
MTEQEQNNRYTSVLPLTVPKTLGYREFRNRRNFSFCLPQHQTSECPNSPAKRHQSLSEMDSVALDLLSMGYLHLITPMLRGLRDLRVEKQIAQKDTKIAKEKHPGGAKLPVSRY